MSISAVRSILWLRSVAWFLACVVLLGAAGPAVAQQNQDQQPATGTPPQQVQNLLDLLRDPAVQKWLEQQPTIGQQPQPAAASAPAQASMTGYFAQRLEYLRNNLARLADEFPKLPAELDRAWIILSLEFEDQKLIGIVFLIATFVGIGFLCVWGYWRLT